MRISKVFSAVLLTILLLVVAAVVVLRMTEGSLVNPFSIPEPEVETLLAAFTAPTPEGEAVTDGGRAIWEAYLRTRSWRTDGETVIDGKQATQRLRVTLLDGDKLGEGLREELSAALEPQVWAAARPEEVYEDGHFRRELLESVFHDCLSARLSEAERYCSEAELTVNLRWQGQQWQLDNAEALAAALIRGMESPAKADETSNRLYAAATAELPYIPLHFSIPEEALAAPVPNPENFGETTDPAVIERLLQRPEAAALIGGQEPVWNAQRERLPGSTIRYYLDETILVLVWQEEEAEEVGTFSEVFIADGSQLRRKIAGDELFSFQFQTASSFAQDTHAVLALGGDFYHHARNCGIGFYQRKLYRFEPSTCDVCYITGDGDMLFSYRNQFHTEDEAQRFAQENDVVFSLVFGPVLIDNGVDVTPDAYPWGEINDRYARSALGMLGRHHYLTMNLNCGTDRYYHLATLRQAANAMIARGCIKAYALDGGQTATTVFNGHLINPVQFGWEKEISDVIYFATALPDE